jgi:hypothetical protein
LTKITRTTSSDVKTSEDKIEENITSTETILDTERKFDIDDAKTIIKFLLNQQGLELVDQ